MLASVPPFGSKPILLIVNWNLSSAGHEHFLVVSSVSESVNYVPVVVPPAWQQLKSEPELEEHAAEKTILVGKRKLIITNKIYKFFILTSFNLYSKSSRLF